MHFYHRYKITKETIINLIKNEGCFRKTNLDNQDDSGLVFCFGIDFIGNGISTFKVVKLNYE